MTRAGNGAQPASTKGRTLQPVVERVFQEFRTCEFSTLARGHTPISWHAVTLWQPEKNRIVLTTSIGLAQMALNIRRDPKVSRSFSDPTASGLENLRRCWCRATRR